MRLIIKNSQMAYISNILEEKANLLLLNYARKRFPDVICEGDEKCSRDWIKSVRKKAKRYGISGDEPLATFIDLVIMYGFDFDESDWSKPTLNSKELSEFEKINILIRLLENQGIFI